MKKQILFNSVALMTLAAATACGGSSPTASTTPSEVATKCPGGEQGFPICYTGGRLQQALPSSYDTSSNEYAIFTEWNQVRSKLGLGPVNHNKLIDASTQNHANYLRLSWIAGEDGHNEVQGRLGFTGINSLERIIFAGYTNAKYGGELMSPEAGKKAFYQLMNAVYHRQGLLDDWITDVGMTSSTSTSTGTSTSTIINYGFSNQQQNDGNYIGVYPYDGETNISLTHSLEDPNPFAGELEMTLANMCTKTSVPVSVISEASTKLQVSSFTIREYGSDRDLSVRLMKQERGIWPNHAVIIGNAPLKPYQKYEVKFIGKVSGGRSGNGFDVTKSWSFTTGTNLNSCQNY